MNCKNFHNDLIFYLDQELPGERMDAVRKHLDEYADCRGFLAMLSAEMEVIDSEKQLEVSPYFFTRLSARLDEKSRFQEKNIWESLVQPAFFSLILIAAIYGGLRVGSMASAPHSPKPVLNVLPYVNDFADEPIETFLLDKL